MGQEENTYSVDDGLRDVIEEQAKPISVGKTCTWKMDTHVKGGSESAIATSGLVVENLPGDGLLEFSTSYV